MAAYEARRTIVEDVDHADVRGFEFNFLVDVLLRLVDSRFSIYDPL